MDISPSKLAQVAACDKTHRDTVTEDEAALLVEWLRQQTKTAAFGVKLIHKCMSKHRYIQKTDCLVRVWAGGIIRPYFFKKLMKATKLQSMVIGIEP
ncbi:hypothetical protein TNCV_1934961 [Trichonephila clavipes]|nr:hypothetical protein TNCV_1934961 [Trichonephila clavipes]